MARVINPLTDKKCISAKPKEKDYKLFDGGGLFLLVKTNNVKSWRMKYKSPEGKESTIVFGNYPLVSLKDAREQKEQTKQLLNKGISPALERQKRKYTKYDRDLFRLLAYEWVEQSANNKKWAKVHKDTVKRTIEKYLFPLFGDKKAINITSRDVIIPINELIHNGMIHTARRIRQFTIAILNHAVFKGVIDLNPALVLASMTIEKKSTHRAAITLSDLQSLIQKIDNYNRGNAITKLALKLNMHIFLRASELVYATWSEIDFTNSLWELPPNREPIEGIERASRGSKMRTPQLIPLSRQALSILREIEQLTGNSKYVFTDNKKLPISSLTPAKAIRAMGYSKDELTFHGFRTLACSTLIESGLFSRDAIERQMSHQERNNVRAAYIHKAEHLKERKLMMQWWSDYIDHVTDHGYIAPYDFKGSIE